MDQLEKRYVRKYKQTGLHGPCNLHLERVMELIRKKTLEHSQLTDEYGWLSKDPVHKNKIRKIVNEISEFHKLSNVIHEVAERHGWNCKITILDGIIVEDFI